MSINSGIKQNEILPKMKLQLDMVNPFTIAFFPSIDKDPSLSLVDDKYISYKYLRLGKL